MNIAGSELLVLFVVLLLPLIALAIALLCWIWMKRSRDSQKRFEQQNDRIISLLERQVELLEKRAR